MYLKIRPARLWSVCVARPANTSFKPPCSAVPDGRDLLSFLPKSKAEGRQRTMPTHFQTAVTELRLRASSQVSCRQARFDMNLWVFRIKARCSRPEGHWSYGGTLVALRRPCQLLHGCLPPCNNKRPSAPQMLPGPFLTGEDSKQDSTSDYQHRNTNAWLSALTP